MIELTNVTKIYDGTVTAVDEVSFEVQEGEIFGLIGTSGCGKTTTLKMINRLEEPTSGSIIVGGDSILNRQPEELRRSIGYVIQDVGLFPHYTVRENISITPKLLQWERGRVNRRSGELLEIVGLTPVTFADRMPADLSGGQQQRVGLARALAADPPIILMDEPFGALDPITKERIQKEFKNLLHKIKKTIVLVTHDVFEAFDLCDRMGLMDQGRMQQIGTPKELLFHPANDFVHSFFDSHRFQLEMMSITIGDILEELRNFSWKDEKPLAEGIEENDRIINLSDSFFSVFDNAHSKERYVILNEEELIAEITPDELLKGFQKVRRTLREGRDG